VLRKELLLAGALVFGATGCSTTYGSGVYTNRDTCVNQSHSYELNDGQGIHVGINDFSTNRNGINDETDITRSGATLVIDGGGDNAELTISGVKTNLKGSFNIALSTTVQNGTFEEEGQTVNLSVNLDASNVAIVGLKWACPTK
jgi:hypothetical protein